MRLIDQALWDETIAPQWRPPAPDSTAAVVAAAAALGAVEAPPPPPLAALPELCEDELAELARVKGDDWQNRLSKTDRALVQFSVDALDYLGDWSCAAGIRDSIVLTCATPRVHRGVTGDEYTCSYDEFTTERHQLHAHIIERMLTSPRTQGSGLRGLPFAARTRRARKAAATAAAAAAAGGPPGAVAPTPNEQHVFFVVGVPGSGKDTVLKRYIRSLGLDLLDASADLVKEYLAAWGQDELSKLVRENNARDGPGKHLLHAQYLHRESILIVDEVVERAMQADKCILLEKTLFNLEPVLQFARSFRAKGCRVHLYGTHITPKKNWDFLSYRMKSGQSFGRYITAEQTISALRNYQINLEALIKDDEKRAVFDGIHVYDVIQERWCVSINSPRTNVRQIEI